MERSVCKFMGVLLHPRQVLQSMLTRHGDALGLVHGGLDWAAQETCAGWAHKFADLTCVHPNVLAGDLRQYLLCSLDCEEFRASSLTAVPGPNCSVVLSDSDGAQITVRKHPRYYDTGQLRASSIFPDTLFGFDYAAGSWQSYVLWDLDLKTQVLRQARIGAVSDIDDPTKVVVYDCLDMPPAVIPGANPWSPDEQDDDGWDDEFGEGEGEGPIDPA